MSTTFTWKILHLERIIEQDSLTDIVATAHWVLEGRNAYNKFGRHYGIQQLSTDNIDPSTFTSFDNITEAQVIEWVKAALELELADFKEGHDTYIACLEAHVQKMIDGSDVYRNTGLPW